VSAGYPSGRDSSERDQLPNWYKSRSHATAELSSDDLLFPPHDDEDEDNATVLPFLPSQAPAVRMASTATPIDIATSRQSSSSPRTQHSNLTSQLQQPRIDVLQDANMDRSSGNMAQPKNRQESAGMLGTTPYGARSIPVRDSYHRDSNALSGSLMGGMSWGGISMGSFIRDE